ncbi:MAG: hypothetical protein JWQ65_1468, partial [Devosia sp.]|nr:hypothetical protein [Devosia sp.]
RLGIVEDYMLAIAAKTDNPSATDREIVTFTLDPANIAWETEGTKYRAELAELPPQQVEMRRFWYVHRNCELQPLNSGLRPCQTQEYSSAHLEADIAKGSPPSISRTKPTTAVRHYQCQRRGRIPGQSTAIPARPA